MLLPPEMLTKPGEPRRLYGNAALSKGMTSNVPFSPMVLAWGEDFLSSFLEDFLGIDITPEKGLVFFAGGHMYMNFSRPPPREEKPGELSGMAVSPGVVTGPVSVLRDPHEKSVNTGDVLVAYTTDPGWKPLFVNAAAVVLEVGGALQHGAIIAREYGKPLVVGIDQLMTKLQDGYRVEVDGTAGVIRLLS